MRLQSGRTINLFSTALVRPSWPKLDRLILQICHPFQIEHMASLRRAHIAYKTLSKFPVQSSTQIGSVPDDPQGWLAEICTVPPGQSISWSTPCVSKDRWSFWFLGARIPSQIPPYHHCAMFPDSRKDMLPIALPILWLPLQLVAA